MEGLYVRCRAEDHLDGLGLYPVDPESEDALCEGAARACVADLRVRAEGGGKGLRLFLATQNDALVEVPLADACPGPVDAEDVGHAGRRGASIRRGVGPFEKT